jgi:hypothetical protein
MFRRSFGPLVVLMSLLPAAAGCAADTADEIAAIDESTADVVSVSKLIGRYESGTGRFASLTFSQVAEGGRRSNRYEGKQIVQCTRAPCPTTAVSGKWFAAGSSLTLYPTNQPRESYKATLSGTSLLLEDAAGTDIAELTKVIPAAGGIAEALAKHGVPNMTSEIDEAEADKQGAAPGVVVSFADALDKALEMFLTDESALRGNVAEFEDDLREECGAAADLVLCLANAPRTTIRLMTLEGDTAPWGDDPKEAWVFEFFVDDFTDHGYYAVIPKNGDAGAHVYAFN